MRGVLLTSELPLRFYLGLYLWVPGFFFGNHFRLLVPPMTDSIVEKFEQILCEHFG